MKRIATIVAGFVLATPVLFLDESLRGPVRWGSDFQWSLPACGDDLQGEQHSPDGNYVALVSAERCGTEYSATRVTVEPLRCPRESALPDEVSPVLVVRGNPGVQARWQGFNRLLVTCLQCRPYDVYRSEGQANGVTITYRFGDETSPVWGRLGTDH